MREEMGMFSKDDRVATEREYVVDIKGFGNGVATIFVKATSEDEAITKAAEERGIEIRVRGTN